MVNNKHGSTPVSRGSVSCSGHLNICKEGGSAEATDTPKRRRAESPAAVIVTMKMLIVSALVCAMMVLTRAAPPPEESIQVETESRLVKRSTDCPHGWSLTGGRCYHYNPIEMTWARALRHCQSQGGNLASVHNIQQDFDIQKVIFETAHRRSPAWIGGTDAQEENLWFWTDGTPFRYRHWCPGEPDNNKDNQHCMQMNYSAHNCWDDLQCSRQLPSVCVRER